MNKLWVFGCSFSTGHRGNSNPYEIELTWPGILADKLGMELKLIAKAAQSNWGSILEFIKYRNEISKDDIVIFEFTFFDRHSFYPTTHNQGDFDDFILKRFGGNVDMFLSMMREHNFEWFNKEVNNWCIDNNIKIWYWSANGETHIDFFNYKNIIEFIPAPTLDTFAIFNEWQDKHSEYWVDNYDRHFNEVSHNILGNHIYKWLDKYEK